jgi:hypothetical protein
VAQQHPQRRSPGLPPFANASLDPKLFALFAREHHADITGENPSRTLVIRFMALNERTPLSRALSATPTQALISDAASTITTPCNRPCRLQVSHQRVRPEPIARKANLKSDCLESKACRPAVSRTSGTGPTTAQHQRTNDCLPCQPFSSSLPGISHSIRCHCSPVNARRIKIVLPGYDLESTFGIRGDLALTSTRPSVSLVSLLRRSA